MRSASHAPLPATKRIYDGTTAGETAASRVEADLPRPGGSAGPGGHGPSHVFGGANTSEVGEGRKYRCSKSARSASALGSFKTTLWPLIVMRPSRARRFSSRLT